MRLMHRLILVGTKVLQVFDTIQMQKMLGLRLDEKSREQDYGNTQNKIVQVVKWVGRELIKNGKILMKLILLQIPVGLKHQRVFGTIQIQKMLGLILVGISQQQASGTTLTKIVLVVYVVGKVQMVVGIILIGIMLVVYEIGSTSIIIGTILIGIMPGRIPAGKRLMVNGITWIQLMPICGLAVTGLMVTG